MRCFIILFLVIIVGSCAKPPIKEQNKDKPAYTQEGLDPQVKVIVDEFLRLSTRNNIKFSHNVTIGFTKIKRTNVIGLCSYEPGFRGIDLDIDFWNNSSWSSKTALVYHELAHCYCERDHDFDEGKRYPDNSIRSFIERFFAKQVLSPVKIEGYMEDGCPTSIMHPVLLGDYCFETHYQHYVQEMFDRCEPW